jgi:uracil-DNA glycosylase family 4
VSGSDPRREAAAIVAGLRELLAREQAQGGAELLAIAATRSRDGSAAVTSAPPPISAPAPTGEPARPPASAPARPTIVPVATFAPTPESSPLDGPGFSDTLLPSHHAELNPIDPAARRAIDAAARPLLDQIAEEIRACRRCTLCDTRSKAVPGTGGALSGIVFVGEAPGADEDAQGEPFVGRAGQLLTRMIAAMDEAKLIPGVPLTRQTVYICNVLKCRPPENRNPLPHEIESCSPFLRRQLQVLRPRIICCLGKFAAELLVGVKGTIAGLRGHVYRYEGAKLIVTYHPAACLRSPSYKRPVWEDLQTLAREYQTDSAG